MALIQCPECGKVLSGGVAMCPSCGMDCTKAQETKKTISSVANGKATENDNQKIVKGLLDETEEERKFREANVKPIVDQMAVSLLLFWSIGALFLMIGILARVEDLCFLGGVISIVFSLGLFIRKLVYISRESAKFNLYGDQYMKYIYPRMETYRQLSKSRELMKKASDGVNSGSDVSVFFMRIDSLLTGAFINQNPTEKIKRYISYTIKFILSFIISVFFTFNGVEFVSDLLNIIFENPFLGDVLFRFAMGLLCVLHEPLLFLLLFALENGRKQAWVDAMIVKLQTEGNPYEAEGNAVDSTSNSLGGSSNGGTPSVPAGKRQKNKVTALLLCIFLGQFGVHRFYEGKIGTGLLYLFTFGLCGVGEIVDLIRLIRTPNPYYV